MDNNHVDATDPNVEASNTHEALAPGKEEAVEDNTVADWAAYIAMTCALLAFVPAVWRIIKRKSACDVSVFGVGLRLTSVCFWLLYAVRNQFVPNMVSSSLSLTATFIYACVVLYYGYIRPAVPCAAVTQGATSTNTQLIPSNQAGLNILEKRAGPSIGNVVLQDISKKQQVYLPPAQGY